MPLIFVRRTICVYCLLYPSGQRPTTFLDQSSGREERLIVSEEAVIPKNADFSQRRRPLPGAFVASAGRHESYGRYSSGTAPAVSAGSLWSARVVQSSPFDSAGEFSVAAARRGLTGLGTGRDGFLCRPQGRQRPEGGPLAKMPKRLPNKHDQYLLACRLSPSPTWATIAVKSLAIERQRKRTGGPFSGGGKGHTARRSRRAIFPFRAGSAQPAERETPYLPLHKRPSTVAQFPAPPPRLMVWFYG
jgi:hypothetical protein